MQARDLRTRFAMKAADVAELFGVAFGHVRIAPAAYAPELMTPDGPSTGGGVQAVQHMRLSSQQPGVPPLVMGSLNLKLSVAEIRSFDHIDAIHRARFKRPVPLDRGEYDRFIDSLQKYFTAMKISTTRTVAPVGGPASYSIPPPPSRLPIILFLAFVAVTLLGASVAYWRLFLHPH
jgi:hypothetical protein